MPSLRAKITKLYLKSAMKSKPLHLIDSETLTANAETLAPSKTPKGVSLEKVNAGAVTGEWHRSVAATRSAPTILYFHGGGYYYGSPKSHRRVTFALAQDADAHVFSQDYRLAPAHPFPAAVEDAIAGYRWLLDHGAEPETVIVSGDSAGGGLSLALLLSCREQRLAMPAGAVLYSPWTDLAVTGASVDGNEKTDAMFKPVHIREGAKHYLGDADPKTPLASPLYADLAGLPPILTFVSDDESLFDDSTRLHQRLTAAGVQSHMVIERGLPHVWPIFHPRFPETKKSIGQSSDFIRRQTKTERAA
ncbi:MAG: alpha/beta hydrolase [Hyphococcus sp.]